MPAEVTGCRVYVNTLAEARPVVVADCAAAGTVDSRGEALKALQGLLGLLSRELSLRLEPEGPESYEAEPLARRRYTVHILRLRGGGEARLVEARGGVLAAALVAPLDAVPGAREALAGGAVEVGEAPRPPVLLRRPILEPDGEPAGQGRIPRFVTYAVEGLPARAPRAWEILVHTPGGRRRLGQELIEERAGWRLLYLHCVTGWSVGPRKWLAAPLGEVLRAARAPLPGDGWLLARSAGGYSAVLPLPLALEAAYLAVGLEEGPLPLERGAPVRLLAPTLYGWKSVKWLREIHVLESYVDGYWEARGYHERGLVAAEERFKLRNPGLLEDHALKPPEPR
ncbi:molybdopterin-dependent oxidoreductase [Pyrodictium occultum]|uniref:molybdopterin-dependent oxidoreductase n=1 Tax=Pyrodictium occultum TaxID=2309 RepID=UPI000AF77A33|nr:molybdopterin-dependent oxidoreductase [Pyrodictium occultum]